MSEMNKEAIEARLAAISDKEWINWAADGYDNADFIAHAPQDITSLLKALADAEAERDAFRDALEFADGHLYTLVHTKNVVKARVRSHLMKAATRITEALKANKT